METIVNSIPEESKNACAIQIMRTMLAKFSDSHGISFDEALLQFTQSDVYETLFDFDTEVWKEGPDYLMMLFKEELDKEYRFPSDSQRWYHWGLLVVAKEGVIT